MQLPNRRFLFATLLASACLAAFAHGADATSTKTTAPGKTASKSRKAEDAGTPVLVNAKRQTAFLERAKDQTIQLVFLGDSITEFWQSRGKTVWEQYYAKYNAANFGVSGEHTEHTLGHIAGGILNGLKPKVAVILIGTNNIGHIADERPEWTAAGIRKVVRAVQDKSSDTKVLLLAVFPREAKDSRRRKAVEAINQMISRLEDGRRTRYLDLTSKFTDAGGEIQKDLMPDKLHLNTEGYQVWAESMQPLLAEMMK